MLVDLHAHYPMHIAPDTPNAFKAMTRGGWHRWSDAIRFRAVELASRVMNYESFDSGPALTVPAFVDGGVKIALSALYLPLDEMDVSQAYGSAPKSHYFTNLEQQLADVESDITKHHHEQAAIAHSNAELGHILADGKMALVHAVEGGFALGSSAKDIRANVVKLAAKGVAYITVAHLFYRGVATNAPAIPFISESMYRTLFPQPKKGLTELGTALIEAMAEHRILIDVTHMSDRSLEDTFQRLDQLDSARKIPVVASHVACRFDAKSPTYNVTDRWIQSIAERNGVVGLIVCDHFAAANVKKAKTFDDSVAVLRAHIDRIRRVTGSDDAIGIGTDWDGYVKPTLKGLEGPRPMAKLEKALSAAYGAALAEKICRGNARRVLQEGWR
jgi:microsomal dipeptidase-like Zn-dependent dipeptidase